MADSGFETGPFLERRASELFRECDVGNKGYLTSDDFAQLNTDLQLDDDAINQVFNSLATKAPSGLHVITEERFISGFSTFFKYSGPQQPSIMDTDDAGQAMPVENRDGAVDPYSTNFDHSLLARTPDDCESGVGSTIGVGNQVATSQSGYEIDSTDWDPVFVEMLNQLSANGIEPHEDGLAELWQRLEQEDPHMLPTFERFIRKVTGELSQTKSYCQSLTQLLRQKVAEHDETITNLHDELEDQVKQETERIVTKIRAQEALERRYLERELEDRDMLHAELRQRLEVLEKREQELSHLVQSSQQETERLVAEKEELEAKLSNRSITDNVFLNDRIRSVQQELHNHQNQFTVEVGRLQAERDVLRNELEEVAKRNNLLRSERHSLSSPLLLNSSNLYNRKGSALPSPLLLASVPTPTPPYLCHHSSAFVYPSPATRHSQKGFPFRSSYRRVPSTFIQSANNYAEPTAACAVVGCENEQAFYNSGAKIQQTYSSNHSLDTLATARTASTDSLYQQTREIPKQVDSIPINCPNSALYKVVILGDSGVGKTAILHRLCYDQFRPAFNATIGMDLHLYPVSVSDDLGVVLQLWDTAGQERYRSMTRQYFRNANAFVLVYDILCETSFLSCRWWLEEIDNISSTKNGHQTILLLGNKADRSSDRRAVSLEQAKSLAMDRGMMFAEVSAATGFGVREVVSQLALHLARDANLNGALKMRHFSTASSIRDDASCQTSDLITSLSNKPQKDKSGCCS